MTTTPTPPATGQQTFRILAADKLAQEGLDWVESQPDAELVHKPGLSEDELARIVGEHDAVLVRSGVKVTAKVLENPGRLKLIARAGVGVDNIDLEAATQQGILVVNTAEANTLTTAEHAFTLMLGVARHIGPAYQTMAAGGWDRSKFKGRQMAGKTLGIVGFGRIGQAIAQRAMAFDMNVVAHDPFINSDTAMDGRVRMHPSFEALLPHVDVVTFHVPLNDQTRGMLNKETFSLAKEGLIVINASRGGVVDEADLAEAVDSGRCGGAGLDVYVEEPPAEDSPLRNHPKILTTPHLGASTVEAQQAVSIDAAYSALAYLRGEGVRGAVNVAGLRLDLSPIQQRYADLAQRMGQLISPLVRQGVREVIVEVAGEDLESAAETLMRMALTTLLREHLVEPVNLINASYFADQRSIDVRVVQREARRYGSQISIETSSGGQRRRIVGRVYDDLKPRVVEIEGYAMDMIPAGHMMLLHNQDQPGVIGLVGHMLGEQGVNIADMTISRRENTALMVLKLDAEAPEAVLKDLRARPGIRDVYKVRLPEEKSE